MIDDTVTDYAGNQLAFCLTIRNAVSHLGIIITMIMCPVTYNIHNTLIGCGYYILTFVLIGFGMCIAIAIRDSNEIQSVSFMNHTFAIRPQ